MEAKELMAFDLVMFDRTCPPTEKKPTRLSLQDIISIEQGKECEPIPLSPEILEKNGWNTPLHNGGFSSQYICDNGDTCVTLDAIHHCLDIRIDDINYDMPRPKCVHELQHALRICGLNELADNFKIM